MMFIYWIEGTPEFSDRVEQIYERIVSRGDQLCTSVFTLGELLVGPKKKGNDVLEAQITRLMLSSEIHLIDIDPNTMVKFAEIRAGNKPSPADSLHLACAATYGVDLFITNDSRLQKCDIQGVSFISGLDGTII